MKDDYNIPKPRWAAGPGHAGEDAGEHNENKHDFEKAALLNLAFRAPAKYCRMRIPLNMYVNPMTKADDAYADVQSEFDNRYFKWWTDRDNGDSSFTGFDKMKNKGLYNMFNQYPRSRVFVMISCDVGPLTQLFPQINADNEAYQLDTNLKVDMIKTTCWRDHTGTKRKTN